MPSIRKTKKTIKHPDADKVEKIRATPESQRDPQAVKENLSPMIPGVDGSRERDEPVAPGDIFHLQPSTRKEYGIKDNEAYAWPRAGSVWKRDEKVDRTQQVVQQGRGAVEVVRDSQGNPIQVGDNVLVKFPKKWQEKQNKITQAESDKFHAEVEHEFDDTKLTGRDRVEKLERAKAASKSILENSSTTGLTLAHAEMINRDRIEEHETLARTGGRFTREEPDDEPRSKSKGRSYSLPGKPTSR